MLYSFADLPSFICLPAKMSLRAPPASSALLARGQGQ